MRLHTQNSISISSALKTLFIFSLELPKFQNERDRNTNFVYISFFIVTYIHDDGNKLKVKLYLLY